MADAKITALTALTSPTDATDVLPIVDVGNSQTKKITVTNLLGAFLAAIKALASNGLIARTGIGTVSARTITGTSNEITVTNGSGASGDPTLSLPTALTFTGKTVTGGTFSGTTAKATLQTITAMGAQAIDGSLGNVFTRTLAASETFTQSNFSTGQCCLVEVKQGSGTSYTVTWFSGITWLTTGGTAPVQTTTSNGYTTYGLRCTGTNTFLGYLVGTN